MTTLQENYYWETKLRTANSEFEYLLFSMLKPKFYQDGNQWCVLLGDDLQSGISGFGDTPYLAILNWSSQFHKKPTAPATETGKS